GDLHQVVGAQRLVQLCQPLPQTSTPAASPPLTGFTPARPPDGGEQGHGVARRLDVVDAHDLGRLPPQGVADGGQRPGQAPLDGPAEPPAEESLARDAEADGPAEMLVSLQPGQQLQVVRLRLAEADARVEHDALGPYTQTCRRLQALLEE